MNSKSPSFVPRQNKWLHLKTREARQAFVQDNPDLDTTCLCLDYPCKVRLVPEQIGEKVFTFFDYEVLPMSYDEAADFVKKNVVCALDVYYSWVKVPRAVNVRVFWNHLRWDLWPEEQAITGVRPIDLNDPLELERVVRVITRYDKGQFSFDFNKVLFKNKYHSRGGYALPSQKKPLF